MTSNMTSFTYGLDFQVLAARVVPNMFWRLARGDMPSLYTRSPNGRLPVASKAQEAALQSYNECPPQALRTDKKDLEQASLPWVEMFATIGDMIIQQEKAKRLTSGDPEPTATCTF